MPRPDNTFTHPTDTELTSRLRAQTIQILLGVVAINAAFLAAASFLLG